MAHGLPKCIHRKLNVADFQCKHKEKYTLNVNLLWFKQFWIGLTRSVEYCKQFSSVNNIQNLVTAFTWIINSSGPSTETWCTPAWIGAVEENIFLYITRCVRFAK